jgi:AAA+ superfamily predicted ATPase
MHFLLFLLFLAFPLFLQSDEPSQPNQDFHLSPLVPTSADNIFDSYSLSPELVAKVIDTMPQQIIDVIFTLNNKELRDKAKPKRLLLVGPPGAGKTTMAQVIAIITQRRYKVIEAPFLLNEYKNSGPQNLFRVIVPMLESGQPCVIIVDEITQLVKQHDKKRDPDPGTAVALWLLLDRCAEYDNVLFVGTCNEMDDFPEQLRSRFGDSGIVHVGLPRLQEVKEIIYHYLSDVNHSCDDRYVTYLAKKLNGKSIRDVQDFMLQAIRLAYTIPSANYKVEPKHFDAIIKTWQPWWYPQKIYRQLKPYAKPFWREVLPTLLQIVGLYLNYCTYRQTVEQGAWSKENAEKQMWLQTAGLVLQWKGFKFQKKIGNKQLDAQYAGLGMQREGLDLQRDGLKQSIKQYETQLIGLKYQKDGLDKQERGLEMQQEGLNKQEKGLVMQDEGLKKQDQGLEMQQQGLDKQERGLEMQQEGLNKQERGLVMQDEGLKKQERGLDMQQQGLDKQDDGLKKQERGLEMQEDSLMMQLFSIDKEKFLNLGRPYFWQKHYSAGKETLMRVKEYTEEDEKRFNAISSTKSPSRSIKSIREWIQNHNEEQAKLLKAYEKAGEERIKREKKDEEMKKREEERKQKEQEEKEKRGWFGVNRP